MQKYSTLENEYKYPREMKSSHFSDSSPVQEFYKNKTIFITGANGFVGIVLLEKFLRACGSLDRIYILLRPKRNLSTQDRLHKLCQNSIFETLSKTNPEFAQKITAISGDLSLPNLGISEEDRHTLEENVHIVINSAASIKLSEPVKAAMETNFHGARRMVKLCKGMHKLHAFVHISTVYTNTEGGRLEIEEKVYPFMNKAQIDKLLQNIDSMESVDTKTLKQLESVIIQGKQNTYLFTKAVAENYLELHQHELPIVIVKPSLVLSTAVEPVPGFLDQMMALSGFLYFVGQGHMHALNVAGSTPCDIIPADYLANLIILAGWKSTYIQKMKENGYGNVPVGVGLGQSSNLTVYHGCAHNPPTFHEFKNASILAMRTHPFPNGVSRPRLYGIPNPWLFNVDKWLFRWVPAFFLDNVMPVNKSLKPSRMKIYNQIEGLLTDTQYFMLHSWKFERENVYKLNAELSAQDRNLFPLFLHNINWTEYLKNYILGIQKYTLKEQQERARGKVGIPNVPRYKIISKL